MSNKNVATEDDIKILKEFAETCKRGIGLFNPRKEGEALERVLAEREQMIAEKKRYTIRLTDEQYRKVIENAQMDTSNDTVVAHRFAVMQQQINEKDKRIQELEEENKRKDMFVEMAKEVIENSILKQTITDKVKENKQILDKTNDGNLRERLYIENGIMKELLGGEK